MSQEQRIQQRLKDTTVLKQVNDENGLKSADIRKRAMRSIPLSDEEIKWLVREVTSGFAFKDMVFEMWIKDDTEVIENLSKGETDWSKKEPRPENIPAGVTEDVSLEDVKVEADGLADEDLTPHIGENDRLEAVPEPVLEGADKIKAILNAAND